MLSPDQTGELVEATCSWARSLETAFGAPADWAGPELPGRIARAAAELCALLPAGAPLPAWSPEPRGYPV